MAKRKEKVDVIIMDPPRSGSTLFFKCRPDDKTENRLYLLQSLYLGRRFANLIKEYEISSIQPVDMFPQTNHVESVVCLTRK